MPAPRELHHCERNLLHGSMEAVMKHTAYTFRQTFTLGTRSAFSMYDDPIHIGFVLARYKFCARMLEGKARVLEVGCGDGIGTPIVAQFVTNVVAVDVEDRLIRSNKRRLSKIKNIRFQTLDFIKEKPQGLFDAVFSIDVLEHIPGSNEHTFFRNTCLCLREEGVCIVGTPNSTADAYASASSRGHHDNLKSHDSLREILTTYFNNVFMFSMNDEVVHTGFGPMAHYLFGMGVGVKETHTHA